MRLLQLRFMFVVLRVLLLLLHVSEVSCEQVAQSSEIAVDLQADILDQIKAKKGESDEPP